jgi:C-terminal processing protease CtpA/Prc
VTCEDTHLRFLPVLKAKEGIKLKDRHIKAIPCDFLLINDTLLVDESHNDLLEKGDRILSIDGLDIQDYLKITYKDRFIYSFALQTYLHNRFKPIYHIVLERHNKKLEFDVDGISYTKLVYSTKTCEGSFFDDSQVGCFRINNFSYNSYLVKRLGVFLKEVQKRKCKNVIFDLRKNHGGNGDRFDEIISMLTNKPSIPYQAGVKLKVSKATYKDYSYSEDDFGKLVDLPDSLIVKECPLDNSRYKGDINYYTLISKNTGSIASSFANIMQYNKIGMLVGEPLAHNALNYGEVITAERDNSFWTISTVENFEYSNTENGILKPDISIPFIASEYMNGGDPVLEKCLEYINNSTHKVSKYNLNE